MTPTDNNTCEYRTEFSPDNEAASMAIIRSIAALRDTDPMNLPALYDSIPCDSLDAGVERGDDAELTFTYDGVRITVQTNGQITIRDPL